MAQEIRIVTWCDNTKKHKDEDVPAETLPAIALGKDKPRDLDLCAECRVELFEPLAALLDNEGRAIDTGRRKNRKRTTSSSSGQSTATATAVMPEFQPDKSGTYLCPVCDAGPFDKLRGVRTHYSMKHGVTSQPTPAQANEEPPQEPAPHTCPTCGKHFERRQGLGAHRSRAHGYRSGDDE